VCGRCGRSVLRTIGRDLVGGEVFVAVVEVAVAAAAMAVVATAIQTQISGV